MASQLNARSMYQYKSLKEGHIRILWLQPGKLDDSIYADISHEKLDESIAGYHALSWQWGDKKKNRIIHVKDRLGKDSDATLKVWTVEVRANLLDALKHLRKKDMIVRLWVDAICIRQDEENNSEKSQQISLMTQIYGMADKVCVWLGNAADDSDKAIQFVRKLSNLDDIDHIARLERSTHAWDSASEMEPLIKLLKRGWFSRRWVVQVSP